MAQDIIGQVVVEEEVNQVDKEEMVD